MILDKLRADNSAAPPAPASDPTGTQQKLLDFVAVLGAPGAQGAYSAEQQLSLNLVNDAIYLAHLISCRQYKLDSALTGLGRMNNTLGRFLSFLVSRRPKVDMFGVATGDKLLPAAFLSQDEADGFRHSIEAAGAAAGAMTVPVELTTSSINPSLQPVSAQMDAEMSAEEVTEIEDMALKLKSAGAGDPAANVIGNPRQPATIVATHVGEPDGEKK